MRLIVIRSCFLFMIPRFKRIKKNINTHLSKEQFLEEHNKLSPENLKATIPLLSRFKADHTLMFKDNTWSVDKIRRPFIFWISSLTDEEKANIKEEKK